MFSGNVRNHFIFQRVTVSIVLIADCNEVKELREQLYQVQQVVKGVKEAVV
ncbi:hypothetical protein ACUVZB_004304 [Citrobacter freundii]|uniref:hypothetical protein n=1 Tax=Citrobacter freundii TaxID=546 RepID=UPI0017813D73|nr:hypothetical protein [Citrobacter freundii]MDT7291769.1 hypothetical protein [Citrobacter freundii]HBU6170306.1 hypothetical protein [Citrobacter freundii]HBV8022352.1 hypothetical protein [Citrobacter freundii]HEG1873342.1 hypothetical protein [Citrobacter freundii]